MRLPNSTWILMTCTMCMCFGCIEHELPVPARAPGNVVVRQVDMGSDYGLQLHFDLVSGEVVAEHPKNAWCVRFRFDSDSVWMDLNGSRFMHIATLADDQLQAEVQEDDVNTLDWSVNHPSSRTEDQLVMVDRAWAIDLGRDPNNPVASLGNRRIEILDVSSNQLTLRAAGLEGLTEEALALDWDTLTVHKDEMISQTHVSLLDLGVVSIEPHKHTWDLYFTQYTTLFDMGPDEDPLEYLVSGVLSHAEGVQVMQPDSGSWEDWKVLPWPQELMLDDWDTIGYDWKSYSIDEGSYTIDTEAIYCIRTNEGREFLLRFLDFYDDVGDAGRFTFETLER